MYQYFSSGILLVGKAAYNGSWQDMQYQYRRLHFSKWVEYYSGNSGSCKHTMHHIFW
jgi:hypothetical protein